MTRQTLSSGGMRRRRRQRRASSSCPAPPSTASGLSQHAPISLEPSDLFAACPLVANTNLAVLTHLQELC